MPKEIWEEEDRRMGGKRGRTKNIPKKSRRKYEENSWEEEERKIMKKPRKGIRKYEEETWEEEIQDE